MSGEPITYGVEFVMQPGSSQVGGAVGIAPPVFMTITNVSVTVMIPAGLTFIPNSQNLIYIPNEEYYVVSDFSYTLIDGGVTFTFASIDYLEGASVLQFNFLMGINPGVALNTEMKLVVSSATCNELSGMWQEGEQAICYVVAATRRSDACIDLPSGRMFSVAVQSANDLTCGLYAMILNAPNVWIQKITGEDTSLIATSLTDANSASVNLRPSGELMMTVEHADLSITRYLSQNQGTTWVAL